MFADYFTVACKSDKGFNVLLIPRVEGVETTPIKTSYGSAAGTAFVTFDNVRVPVDNLLGKEGKGFAVIMSNFNHERWIMCCVIVRSCRFIIEECMKWSNQRLIFKSNLLAQPVIRHKFARMIAVVEGNQAWLESITYQMTSMTATEINANLAGSIALLKMASTRMAHDIADDAVQIFGGRLYLLK